MSVCLRNGLCIPVCIYLAGLFIICLCRFLCYSELICIGHSVSQRTNGRISILFFITFIIIGVVLMTLMLRCRADMILMHNLNVALSRMGFLVKLKFYEFIACIFCCHYRCWRYLTSFQFELAYLLVLLFRSAYSFCMRVSHNEHIIFLNVYACVLSACPVCVWELCDCVCVSVRALSAKYTRYWLGDWA